MDVNVHGITFGQTRCRSRTPVRGVTDFESTPSQVAPASRRLCGYLARTLFTETYAKDLADMLATFGRGTRLELYPLQNHI